MARDLSPDIVLLDIHLPGITAFEVAHIMDGWPDPPAIVFDLQPRRLRLRAGSWATAVSQPL